MIKNERQYHITKTQAEKFERALADLKESKGDQAGVNPILQQAMINGMESQLSELRMQVEEYEALKSGRRQTFSLDSFAELPRALIQSRIAMGLSQKELAERLGLKEQQVQRYEATEYAGAGVQRLNEVIRALGLQVREEVVLPQGGP